MAVHLIDDGQSFLSLMKAVKDKEYSNPDRMPHVTMGGIHFRYWLGCLTHVHCGSC